MDQDVVHVPSPDINYSEVDMDCFQVNYEMKINNVKQAIKEEVSIVRCKQLKKSVVHTLCAHVVHCVCATNQVVCSDFSLDLFPSLCIL